MLNEIIGSVVQLLLFSLIPAIVWFITARKKESFFKWIGLKKPVCAKPVLVIALSLAVAAVYIGVMFIVMKNLPEGVTTAGSQFAGQGFKVLPAIIFYALVRTALSEEIFFRGFLLKVITRKTGFTAANIIQAVCFGLMHGIPFGLATGSVATTILLTILPGLVGWYQGWMNEKQCEGSIIPSWILHGCMNLLTSILSL